MADKKLLGRWGEALTADYFRSKGYTITALNYATRFGEVDLIAESRKFVVFAEVKLRKDSRFAEAKEFVTREKQRRILAAAGQWLSENECGKQPRFDVVEIYAPDGMATEKPQIIHTEDAFGADE